MANVGLFLLDGVKCAVGPIDGLEHVRNAYSTSMIHKMIPASVMQMVNFVTRLLHPWPGSVYNGVMPYTEERGSEGRLVKIVGGPHVKPDRKRKGL